MRTMRTTRSKTQRSLAALTILLTSTIATTIASTTVSTANAETGSPVTGSRPRPDHVERRDGTDSVVAPFAVLQAVPFAKKPVKKTTRKRPKTTRPAPVAATPTTSSSPFSPPTLTPPAAPVDANTPAATPLADLAGQVVPTTAPPGVAPASVPSPVIAAAQFSKCVDSDLECARVTTPLDYRKPTGSTITLFVARRRATGPAPRLGTLFVNPGGPGGPTYDLVRSSNEFLTPAVLERFDIVGVDPRGTERSAPLRCESARKRNTDKNYADALARTCAAQDGERLPFMDTETAARDLDAVRLSLGEERISYLGMSYGTYLGAVYRALFPTRVQGMILDSGVDPARFGVDLIVDPVIATETALDAFLTECASGRLNPCAFNDGTDLKAKYAALREKTVFNRNPLGRAELEQLFDNDVADFVGYPRNGWPVLGRALQEVATTGKGNFAITAADNPSTSSGDTFEPLDTFSTATNVAVNCRDGLLPNDPAADETVRTRILASAPRFSGLVDRASLGDTCVNWIGNSTPVPLSALTPSPVLVIANSLDLTTPLRWSEGLAKTLRAPLLVRNGGGHVAITKSACVQEAAAAFWISGTLPPPDLVCSPSFQNPT